MATANPSTPQDQDSYIPTTSDPPACSDDELGTLIDGLLNTERTQKDYNPRYVLMTDAEIVDDTRRRLRSRGFAPVDDSRITAMLECVLECQRREQNARRLESFLEAVGRRYSDCKFSTYQVSRPEQQTAVDAVKGYIRQVKEHVAKGAGLLLFGPAGVGKDHLVVAAARAAIGQGVDVKWVNGRDLFGTFRDRMDSTGVSEAELIGKLVDAEVLAISDPLPPSGELTPYQADLLFRIIDGRYRDLRPTWSTLNVAGGTEAGERMGAQVVDRLRDGAVAVHCNWPTYRKALA